jgi:hypothetical protein
VRTPATSVRSLIETGNPASQPASPAASVVAPPCMMRRARSRARSRHRVGSAFTAGSTSAMRWAEASTSSRGEISRFLSRARASTADIRRSSLVIECFPTSAQDRDTQLCPAPRRTTALSHAPTAETFPSRPLARYFQEQRRAQDWKRGLCEQRGRRAHLPPRGWLFKRGWSASPRPKLYTRAVLPPAILACSSSGTPARISARIFRDCGKVDSLCG